MAIKPLDLQTMFARMDEISKGQAKQKEQVALQQNQAAKEQVEKEIENDRKVTKTNQDMESLEVKDDHTHSGEPESRHKGKNKKQKKAEKNFLSDPSIGNHIDLLR